MLMQNRYWAKPGKADEVFQWRKHATDVQAQQMGMARGRVFRGGGGDEPDAVWQLELDPALEAEELRLQREHQGVFIPVMEHMNTIAGGFEAAAYCEVRFRR
jgi:hypothetical protein